MGLGLARVTSIVWAVGGTCRITNRDDRPGVVVELTVPVSHRQDLGGCAQTSLCLRQHGTSQLLFVFSLAERKNEQQKEDNVPLLRRVNRHHRPAPRIIGLIVDRGRKRGEAPEREGAD